MQSVLYIIVLVVLQALLFNRIHLFDVATPLIYVYYVLRMPRDTNYTVSLVVSFLLGVCIDTFSNTPGLAAASLTLMAFVRPKMLELYLHKEDPDDFSPTLGEMGFIRYFFYILPLVLLYCLTFFSLEAFTFVHWYEWLLNILGSLAITLVLIMAIESVRK